MKCVNRRVSYPFVYVELSPRLASVLPPHFTILRFEKASFAITEFIERYKQVVDHFRR